MSYWTDYTTTNSIPLTRKTMTKQFEAIQNPVRICGVTDPHLTSPRMYREGGFCHICGATIVAHPT